VPQQDCRKKLLPDVTVDEMAAGPEMDKLIRRRMTRVLCETNHL
jgi:hypothetical protein